MGQNGSKIDKNERNKRFFIAVDYLFSHDYVTSQRDLAAKIGISEAGYSRLKNGLKNVSDDTFRKLNAAVGCIFNMSYFRGESDVLIVGDNKPTADAPEQAIDQSSLVNALLAANNQTIESLKRELASEKESHEREVAQMQARIEEQADHIQTLKGRLMEYRKIIDAAKIEIGNYPFPMGVAEDHQYKTK